MDQTKYESPKALDILATQEHRAITELAQIAQIRQAIYARPDLEIQYDPQTNKLHGINIAKEATHVEIRGLPISRERYIGGERPRHGVLVLQPFIMVRGRRVDDVKTSNIGQTNTLGGFEQAYHDIEARLTEFQLPSDLINVVCNDLSAISESKKDWRNGFGNSICFKRIYS